MKQIDRIMNQTISEKMVWPVEGTMNFVRRSKTVRRKQVKKIIVYYNAIPEMIKLLEREKEDLEGEYNCLHGSTLDPLTHGSAPGKPTENLALRVDEKSVRVRLLEINVRKQVLHADAAVIRACIDALNGKYKKILYLKYMNAYSWAKIAVSLGTPDGTVRRWNDRALDRLGEVLDESTMPEEILCRASCACV